jgi:mRNA-degrading endonuclease RelE of RelBE toxin-antitoxin system
MLLLKVTVRGPKEDVMKACQQLLELTTERQLSSYSVEVRAKPQHHKFLIGKNGANIKKIRDLTGARIVFPTDKDEDKEVIIIIGRREAVEHAKVELEATIKEIVSSRSRACYVRGESLRGAIQKFPKCIRKKADTLKVLIATVPFKVVPLEAYTTIPTFLPRSEAVLEVFCVSVFSTFCDLAWISSTVSNLRPFNLVFILGKRKKLQGTKSGEYGGCGMTVMFLEAKKCCTAKAMCTGALS